MYINCRVDVLVVFDEFRNLFTLKIVSFDPLFVCPASLQISFRDLYTPPPPSLEHFLEKRHNVLIDQLTAITQVLFQYWDESGHEDTYWVCLGDGSVSKRLRSEVVISEMSLSS